MGKDVQRVLQTTPIRLPLRYTCVMLSRLYRYHGYCLPIGSCMSVSFEPVTRHCMASFRPSKRSPSSRHVVSPVSLVVCLILENIRPLSFRTISVGFSGFLDELWHHRFYFFLVGLSVEEHTSDRASVVSGFTLV